MFPLHKCSDDGGDNTEDGDNLCEIHNEPRCIESGCNNIPRKNQRTCPLHGGCKVCIEPGCNNRTTNITHKCKFHNRIICNRTGCDKTAKKGYDKCITHINERWCNTDGCNNMAYGKYNKCILHFGIKCVIPWCETRIKSINTHCKLHKQTCIVPGCTNKKALVDLSCFGHGGGRRCDVWGCNKPAINKYDKCMDHRFGNKCIVPGCGKNSMGRTHRCGRHGGARICNEPNCNKFAAGATYKCRSHGGGNRCPNCIDWIDSRCGSPKHDGYCATCFKHLFPDDPRSKKSHMSKEMMVRNFINEYYDGFVHNIPLYTGNCNCAHRRRIDHRKLFGNTILAIETDEFGHRGYDKVDEEIRYDDVYMIHSGKWIFIRFNPDNNVSKVDIEDKLTKLKETMDECIDRIEYEENTELVEIIKLFC